MLAHTRNLHVGEINRLIDFFRTQQFEEADIDAVEVRLDRLEQLWRAFDMEHAQIVPNNGTRRSRSGKFK